jgi:hypothetical protein
MVGVVLLDLWTGLAGFEPKLGELFFAAPELFTLDGEIAQRSFGVIPTRRKRGSGCESTISRDQRDLVVLVPTLPAEGQGKQETLFIIPRSDILALNEEVTPAAGSTVA